MKVRIPAPLRASTGSEGRGDEWSRLDEGHLLQGNFAAIARDHSSVEVEASDIAGLLRELELRFPGIGERLRDKDGNLRRLVGIYVNGENIHFLSGLDTPLRDGDEVSIVPVVAGGLRVMNPCWS